MVNILFLPTPHTLQLFHQNHDICETLQPSNTATAQLAKTGAQYLHSGKEKHTCPVTCSPLTWSCCNIAFVTELGIFYTEKKLLKPHVADLFSPFPEGRFMVYTPISFHSVVWGIRLRATNWEFKLHFKKYNSYGNEYIFKILQEHGQKLTVMSCWACQSSSFWLENHESWSHMLAKDITSVTNKLEMATGKPMKTQNSFTSNCSHLFLIHQSGGI